MKAVLQYSTASLFIYISYFRLIQKAYQYIVLGDADLQCLTLYMNVNNNDPVMFHL